MTPTGTPEPTPTPTQSEGAPIPSPTPTMTPSPSFEEGYLQAEDLSFLTDENGVYLDKDETGIDPTPSVTPSLTPSNTPTNASSNYWYFYALEGPIEVGGPTSNGQALFSDNVSGDTNVTFNPNKSSGVDFFNFCLNDVNGISFLTQFTNLHTNGGTISVTQNGITATYTVTTGMTFINSGLGFVSINVASSTQTVIANSPFVYGDPISIIFGN